MTLAANWLRKPAMATAILLCIMYGAGVLRYEGFDDTQIVLNIFIDNGFLLVVAVGMTFVILTGGIDLSVGAVVALTTMIAASLLEKGLNPALVLVVVLAVGGLIGLGMGCIIHFFDIQPFIATLAGMFLARGTCYVISTDSIPITNEWWNNVASAKLRFGGFHISWSVVIAAVVVAAAAYVLAYTRLGRNIYALGGNQQSALLMGLPVGRTRITVYTISGVCSALGGVLLTFYTPPATGSTPWAWSSTRSRRSSSAAPCSPEAPASCSAPSSASGCSASSRPSSRSRAPSAPGGPRSSSACCCSSSSCCSGR
ncbi:ABC transporter permease subunit [Dactylosporangium darangshiense]|uniref:ABC transporter permease subunit n=1 Tax=Dactylosporangium darangshiense TaxID=579108 RepID=UPI00362C97F9